MVEEKVAEQYQYSGLDILKAILAITVVLRHIEQGIGKESLFAFIWGAYLSPVAVPCFFIISGYLFFIKEPTRERLWHQVKRILSLYLWWLILYSPIIIYDWIKKIRNGEILRNLIKHFIQETIFAGGVLPFMVFNIFGGSINFNIFIRKIHKRQGNSINMPGGICYRNPS